MTQQTCNSSITAASADTSTCSEDLSEGFIVREGVRKEICKQVIRKKLSKLRHLVIEKGISSEYLDSLFPRLLELFEAQKVIYNGGIANVKEWKISCYLEVMNGGIPCTNPNLELLDLFTPLLHTCNDLFLEWYRQQHSCNLPGAKNRARTCKRLMTFITRYTPAPGEQALLKVRMNEEQMRTLKCNTEKVAVWQASLTYPFFLLRL
jgi:hypothetical protein